MKWMRILAMMAMLAAVVFVGAACEKKGGDGALENSGEAMDDALEDAADAVKDAVKDAAEDAKDAAKDAAEDVKEKVEN